MIETDRLLLRSWKQRDRAPFAALNADPAVMRHASGPLDAADSAFNCERLERWDAREGFTLWPVIRKADGHFLGICGLSRPRWTTGPDLEIGWRFARAWWGQGYAREAAEATLAFGLLRAPRILATTAPANTASRTLMRRLRMVRLPGLDHAHEGARRLVYGTTA